MALVGINKTIIEVANANKPRLEVIFQMIERISKVREELP